MRNLRGCAHATREPSGLRPNHRRRSLQYLAPGQSHQRHPHQKRGDVRDVLLGQRERSGSGIRLDLQRHARRESSAGDGRTRP